MIRRFADSYFWLAYLNPKDQGHELAVEWMGRLRSGVFTTEWVLVEVADAMSNPKNREAAVEFLNTLRCAPELRIIDYERPLFDKGFHLFATRPDKEWSLTDCISFALMEREGITEALTGDHHFEQAGFVAHMKLN